MPAAVPWRSLYPEQRQWVRDNISNGCGPQQGGAEDLCKNLQRIALIPPESLQAGIVDLDADGPELVRVRDRLLTSAGLAERICGIFEEACHRHDWDYARGGSRPWRARRRSDKRMRIGMVNAAMKSSLPPGDKKVAIIAAGLGWLGVRLFGRDDFTDEPRTMEYFYSKGMPR